MRPLYPALAVRSIACGLAPWALSLACVVAAPLTSHAKPPERLTLTGDLAVHDPVMIKQDGVYHLFCTGGGRRSGGTIPVRTSTDMRAWKSAGFALEKLPEWVATEVPEARNAWAPDISYFNGRYQLYYSLSSFGVNTSAIGLATNKTLDPQSPDYKWEDQGLVIRSRKDDDYNAIDPNFVVEDPDHVWLTWGSFWGGIKMRSLDPKTGKLLAGDDTIHTIAARPRSAEHVTPPVEGAIEAPFIVRHDDHWVLFVSWDFCCRGPRSNYKVVVGRAEKITGPYLDKDGKDLAQGGGTLILEANTSEYHGAGHPAVYSEDGADYLLVHAYRGRQGRSELQILPIEWTDGWPAVAQFKQPERTFP
jgi:arabinan endo-1,5-alpha-L-arabinosidase